MPTSATPSTDPMRSSADLFQDPEVSDRYLEHYGTLRGKVREQIVRRHLEHVVLSEATQLEAADVGCGDGRDALWLAELGHKVFAVDPSQAMAEHVESLRRDTDPALSLDFQIGDASTVLSEHGEKS